MCTSELVDVRTFAGPDEAFVSVQAMIQPPACVTRYVQTMRADKSPAA